MHYLKKTCREATSLYELVSVKPFLSPEGRKENWGWDESREQGKKIHKTFTLRAVSITLRVEPITNGKTTRVSFWNREEEEKKLLHLCFVFFLHFGRFHVFRA